MILWRLFQLLIAFAGGSFVIYMNQPEQVNPLIVGGVGIGFAYFVTIGLAKLLDFSAARQKHPER
jgi:hypothetical protein